MAGGYHQLGMTKLDSLGCLESSLIVHSVMRSEWM